MASKRTDNPDGTYEVGVFTDDQLNEVAEKDATRVIITEYDQRGRWVSETVGVLEP